MITSPPGPAFLGERCRGIRASVLRMAYSGRTPHVGSALSCVEIVTCLYFSVLVIDPARPNWPDRDRFILSKGHGCMALYATLAERGFFPLSLLSEYALDGGCFAEHPGAGCAPGIDAASGSLGHGLSLAAGLALASRISGRPFRAFALLSDAECCEGSVWEAAAFASRYALNNLIAIVDFNKWSAMERTQPMVGDLAGKWRAFGWRVAEVDGHDVEGLTAALREAQPEVGKPTAVIAHTVKGKGVSFMEDDLEWHYRPPNAEDLSRALAEVERGPERAS